MEIYDLLQLETIKENKYNNIKIIKLNCKLPDNLFFKLFNFRNLSHLIISAENEELLKQYYNKLATFSKLIHFQITFFSNYNKSTNLKIIDDISFFYLENKLLWLVRFDFCYGCHFDDCSFCNIDNKFKNIISNNNLKKINIINIYSSLLYLLNRLPNSLEYLQLVISYIDDDIEIINNLPPSLKKLRIIVSKFSRNKIIEKIKLPFDCRLEIIEK